MGLLSGDNDADSPTISVFPDNSFLQSAHSVPSVHDVGTVNLGTVLDYAFFAANTPSSSATAYAAGPSAIVGTTVSNTGTNGAASRAINQVFTTNDPGAVTPTPNFTNRQFTMGSNNTLTGIFDLAPLAGGNTNDLEIDFISGGWNSFTNLSVTETGQPTNTFIISNALAGNREQYLNKITISDFDGS